MMGRCGTSVLWTFANPYKGAMRLPVAHNLLYADQRSVSRGSGPMKVSSTTVTEERSCRLNLSSRATTVSLRCEPCGTNDLNCLPDKIICALLEYCWAVMTQKLSPLSKGTATRPFTLKKRRTRPTRRLVCLFWGQLEYCKAEEVTVAFCCPSGI